MNVPADTLKNSNSVNHLAVEDPGLNKLADDIVKEYGGKQNGAKDGAVIGIKEGASIIVNEI